MEGNRPIVDVRMILIRSPKNNIATKLQYCLRIWREVGCCENADEPAGCTKCGGFLDRIKNDSISCRIFYLPI